MPAADAREVVGLLPASGRATRLGGLPKFALPCDDANTPLIAHQIALMAAVCDRVVVSTTRHWVPLIEVFELDVALMIIEPSTMNDAVIKMARFAEAPAFVIGMADTYFLGENPYPRMASGLDDAELVVAAWPLHADLRGRVGQILIEDGQIVDSQDKTPECPYPHMWGSMGMSDRLIERLDPEHAHPGIDLPTLLADSRGHGVVPVAGEYFDVGTFRGYKSLIDRIHTPS